MYCLSADVFSNSYKKKHLKQNQELKDLQWHKGETSNVKVLATSLIYYNSQKKIPFFDLNATKRSRKGSHKKKLKNVDLFHLCLDTPAQCTLGFFMAIQWRLQKCGTISESTPHATKFELSESKIGCILQGQPENPYIGHKYAIQLNFMAIEWRWHKCATICFIYSLRNKI